MKRLALAAILLALAACASDNLPNPDTSKPLYSRDWSGYYGMGDGWRQQHCARMIDRDQQQRCMAQANRSYEEYNRGLK
jgi:hypothetical protein